MNIICFIIASIQTSSLAMYINYYVIPTRGQTVVLKVEIVYCDLQVVIIVQSHYVSENM